MTPIQTRSPAARAANLPGLHLTVWSVWKALKSESWAFHALLFYVAWEYWRPQNMWPVIDVIPWGRVTIVAATAAFFLTGERGRRFHPMDGLFIGFTVWLFATIPMGLDPAFALENWEYMASWVFLYFFVSHIVVTPRRLLLFWVAMMVIFSKMSQHGALSWVSRGFSFAAWGVTGSPVWFQNSGEFAMGMVIFLAMSWCVLVAVRPYVPAWVFWVGTALPVTALMSVLASSSRGGQLAALAVILLLVRASRARWKGVALILVVLSAGWAMLPDEQKQRFSSIGTEEDTTGELRLIHWGEALDVIRERPVFGIGYEGWMPYYRSTGAERQQQIHNTFLEAPTELGLPGAALFFAMIGGSFLVNRRTRRVVRRLGDWGRLMEGMLIGLDLAMIGLMIASVFMSVLFWPVYWMAFALSVSVSETSRRMVSSLRRQSRVATRQPAVPTWARPSQQLTG